MDGKQPEDDLLVMGRIAAPYGVKGWVHIAAFTEQPENLLNYLPWYINRQGNWQAPRQGPGGTAARLH